MATRQIFRSRRSKISSIIRSFFDGTGVHCFVAGTKIKMGNFHEKNIENLKENDEILSFDEKTKTFQKTKIKKLAQQIHSNLYEIQFEKSKVIVTDDHPFYFEEKYYAILENSKYVSTLKLEIGKYVNTFDQNKIGNEKVISIKKLDRKEMAYTIIELEKNELFLANNLLVKTEKLASKESAIK